MEDPEKKDEPLTDEEQQSIAEAEAFSRAVMNQVIVSAIIIFLLFT